MTKFKNLLLLILILIIGAFYFKFGPVLHIQGQNGNVFYDALEDIATDSPQTKYVKLIKKLQPAENQEPKKEPKSQREEPSAEEEQEIEAVEAYEQLEFTSVDESYFYDALFIGDSRMAGLHTYAGFEGATYYCTSGMSVYKVFDDPQSSWNQGDNTWPDTLEHELETHQYGKIYIMLGINELGYRDTYGFFEQYGNMVAVISQYQPNAIIYIMDIMHVTTERSMQGDEVNNELINERNTLLHTLADGQRIFSLNINEIMDDATGGLNADMTSDGVHIYAADYMLQHQWLMDHAIVYN